MFLFALVSLKLSAGLGRHYWVLKLKAHITATQTHLRHMMVRKSSGSIVHYIVIGQSRKEGDMAIHMTGQQNTDYFIVGPALKPGNGVLEAIYSLFYLPQNYKLILPTAAKKSDRFFDDIVALVKKNDLEQRVYFSKENSSVESPEGFASAVLNTARSGYCM
jgi:hypothetical protein